MKIFAGVMILIVLLIGTIVSLPFLIDLNKYQAQYKPVIEEALNRKIQLKDIRLTIWPRIGARVAGFTVLDDPSFGSEPFASLTSLDVAVKLIPLLRKKIEVEGITLRDPMITVIKNKSGVTNVSTIGRKEPAAPTTPVPESPQQPSGSPLQALALLAVDRVSIDGGKLTYRDLTTTPATEYQVQNLELLLTSVHLGETPTLHLGATVQPYNLPVALDGSFGPLVEELEVKHYDFTLGLGKIALAVKGALVGGKLETTLSSPSISTADVPMALPLSKPVYIKDLHVAATAPYPLKQRTPAIELADVTDLRFAIVTGDSSIGVNGSVLGGHAKLTGTAPSVNTTDLPVEIGLKKPVEMKNLEVIADLKGQDARLSNFSLEVFNGRVKAQGGTSIGSRTPPFHGKVTSHGIQLGPVLAAVAPDIKLTVSGTAAMDIAVEGRGFSMADLTKSLEGPGHLEIKDGKIDGVNLLQEAVTLLKVAGVSIDSVNTTVFSTVESDIMIKRGLVNVQKLLLDSQDFQATGNGTVGFDQALNLAVNLNLSKSVSQKLAASSPVAKLALKDGRVSVPLIITGTAQNPSYGLNMKDLSGKVQRRVQEKLEGAAKGLLEGTTKPSDLKKEGEDLLKGLFGR